MLMVGVREIATTDDGFLLDASDWDTGVAAALAADVAIELTDAHWEIIRFMQDYYRRYRHLPNMRMFVKAIQKTLGDDKGNSRYLHRLFPDGPLKLACRIGGLPKPPSCI
ncbi:TusE/DsrC/DsvC family sulfur relay protein [Methylotetracoccus oryzae]|uniref:TusE/DsrC/DsvC family sulfur relay protein n=1 Tax=Methylotetracoccus oryzae TaxID=1919059 RepID=UPI0011190EEF|nr:TusE/DsrC/DsvC family sulfur relay protein [Methylotetracoccus oryzae]